MKSAVIIACGFLRLPVTLFLKGSHVASIVIAICGTLKIGKFIGTYAFTDYRLYKSDDMYGIALYYLTTKTSG